MQDSQTTHKHIHHSHTVKVATGSSLLWTWRGGNKNRPGCDGSDGERAWRLCGRGLGLSTDGVGCCIKLEP